MSWILCLKSFPNFKFYDMNYKNNRLTYAIILFLFIVSASFSVHSQSLDLKKLDKYIKSAQKQWNIPGLAIAIVKNDEVIFSKAYGVKEFGKKDKVTDKSLFAIASNTKAFTASALSILVDEGKIKWDDPVRKYLPYFQLYNPYVSENMTIRDLLCHRAGFATFAGDLVWYGTTYSRKEIIERARYIKPTYGFRAHYGYSNIMFLTAGEIIPAVRGKSWDDFIKENFFEPLKMSSTNTSIQDFTKNDDIAMPHHVEPGKEPVPINYVNWDNIAPAGAINSCVSDLSNWIRMQLNDGKFEGKQILSKKQIRIIRSPQIMKTISKWSEETYPSKHFSAYGLAWDLFDYHGRKIINHGGGADGMISKTVLVPEEDLGFVILTNSINYLPTALMYYILDDYFDVEEKDWSSVYYGFYTSGIKRENERIAKAEAERNKNSKPSLVLQGYTGTYRSDLYGDVEVKSENGKLVVYFVPTPMFVGDLEHWQYNTFSIKLRKIYSLPKGTVNFILNDKGSVTQMEIDIPNPDFDFTELKLFKIED